MKPIDTLNKKVLAEENARKFLNNEEYSAFISLPVNDRVLILKRLLNQPVCEFTVIGDLYFRSKWAELIWQTSGNRPVTVIEVASGDADMIPQTMARSNPGSIYITANMNQRLNESLLHKTRDLDLGIQLIEDDALHIKSHIGTKVADLIAFQHGANDVIQAILCDRAGIDTVYCDWMELLPKMIQLLQQEMAQGTLEQNVKSDFLGLIAVLLEELKDDGIIAISHYMFQLDLDWGYPAELFENIIPIIRQWLTELENCKEVFFENFDKNWWLFLEKTTATSY